MTSPWCPVCRAIRGALRARPTSGRDMSRLYDHEPRPRHHRKLLVQRSPRRGLRRVVVLAASGLELRRRSAARPRAGRRVLVEGVDATEIEQAYLENTNVLRTVFRADDGDFELIDFAPRFNLYDRFFKPSMLVRIVRPLEGEPRARRALPADVRVRLQEIGRWRASNHIAVHRLSDTRPPDDERAAQLRRGRAAVPARARPPPRPRPGASRSRPASRRPPSASSSARSTTGAAG